MEDLSLSTPPTSEEKEQTDNLCVNCQTKPFEPGHAVNLCANCRAELIKYPIPNWITFFAVGLAVVIVLSLIRTKSYISAAIDLGKAENAIENRDFVTAQREVAKGLSKFPDDVTANSNMVIAASYNLDLAAVGISYSRIAEKPIDDEELLAQTNAATAYVEENFVQDTVFKKKIDTVAKNLTELGKLATVLQEKQGEPGLSILVANYLFDLKDYATVEKICLSILTDHPNSYSALSLMSAMKRNTLKFDEAIAYCDKILAVNKQNVYAIAQKARIELKRKRDSKAAAYAEMAMKIDPTSDSSLEAMAMVHYFAGRKAKSLETLAAINANAANTGDSTISKRLTPIINGTTIYR